MSLFPAYSAGGDKDDDDNDKEGRQKEQDRGRGEEEEREWLRQKSYKHPPTPPSGSTRRSRSRSPRRRRRSSSHSSRSSSSNSSRSSYRRRRSRSRSPPRRRRRSPPRKDKKREKKRPAATSSRDVKPKSKLSNDVYFVDKAGERSLRKNEQLPAKMQASRYRKPWFWDEAMGSPSSWNKDRKKKKEPPRFFHKAYIRSFLEAEDRVLDLSNRDGGDKGQQIRLGSFDVIPIGDGAKEEVEASAETNPLKIYDMSTVRYLEGRGGLDIGQDVPTESIRMHQIQEKTRGYNERLRREPANVDLWLEFVEFQNVSVGDMTEFASDASAAAGKKKDKSRVGKNVVVKQQALVEKKLAILKAATDKNPGSVELAVKRLEYSREILDAKTLDRQWKELLFLFPKNFDLWRFYLRSTASNFTTFTVARILKEYKACLDKLRQLHGDHRREQSADQVESQMNAVLLALTRFLARAGFRERAVAIFQAMIEINFFSPAFPAYFSNEDRLALFEPFWESGVPRFGEDGVVAGWASVMKNKDSMSKPEEEEEEDSSITNASGWEDELIDSAGFLVDRNRLWLELEVGRERRHWCPWRSSEDDAEDPDRMVGFEDISGYLFQFTRPEQKFRLVLGFLRFLGVAWRDEPFLPANLCSQTFSDRCGFGSAEALDDCVDWQPDIIVSVLQNTGPDVAVDRRFYSFCRNVFSQSVRVLEEPRKTQTVILWLRFELWAFERADDTGDAKERKAKTKEIKNLVKNLLQDDQRNMDVYAEYARIERRTGGFKAGWKIMETALAAAKPTDSLYRSAIAMVLAAEEEEGKDELALWLLCLAGQSKPYSREIPKNELASVAETVKSSLQGDIHLVVMSGKLGGEASAIDADPIRHENAVCNKVFLAAWIALFIDGAEAASGFVDFVVGKLPDAAAGTTTNGEVSLIRENLFKIKLDLLARSGDSKQACRAALGSALAAFPRSEYFLQKLLDFDVLPTVVDSTWRSFVGRILDRKSSPLSPGSPLPQLYAAKLLVRNFARHCGDESTDDAAAAFSYLQRCKHLLEQFVRGDPGRHSPVLWRLLMWTTYMLNRNKSNSKVEEAVNTVFYRCLQDCPAVKPVFIDVVTYLHPTMQTDAAREDRLRRVLDIVAEKEARTRMPLEELELMLEKEEMPPE